MASRWAQTDFFLRLLDLRSVSVETERILEEKLIDSDKLPVSLGQQRLSEPTS
jgi:hypothetical protein